MNREQISQHLQVLHKQCMIPKFTVSKFLQHRVLLRQYSKNLNNYSGKVEFLWPIGQGHLYNCFSWGLMYYIYNICLCHLRKLYT